MVAETGTVAVLSFILRGKMAHFRQPDTTVTQGTYPFPPRTTLLGLLGAILGIDNSSEAWPRFLSAEHYLGLKLLAPVCTVCMQMSLLGKGFVGGGGKEFNRPTVMEMVVDPHYQIYYSGESLTELQQKIAARQSVFHTYLGSAFCMTFPDYLGVDEAVLLAPVAGEAIEFSTVVPQALVDRVELAASAAYAAARAMPYCHRGNRTFEGSCTFFYEVSGRPLQIIYAAGAQMTYRVAALPSGEVICLW